MGISEGCEDPGAVNRDEEPEKKELSYRSSDKGKDKAQKLMKSEAEVMISSGVAQILIQGQNGLGVPSRPPTPSLL